MSDISTLPVNSTRLERSLETLIRNAFRIDVPIGDLWNPDRCPEHALKFLAWAMSVDFWDDQWPLPVKRQTIRQSIAVHREKGTLSSIKRALNAASYGDVSVIEAKALPRLGRTHELGRSWKLGLRGVHWADYWVEVSRPIDRRAADQLVRLLATVAPVFCRLRAITVRNIQYVLGANDWALGTNIPLGGTFRTEVNYG
ncbi:phage tail protein I [Halocynthiibacter styelae]|uniref:Phage tail protein I n=1 Tax=Halocynthiibacter styelae TaxID=2761955 RepID=A0A8J7J8L0_9RHOB|nr:phage tail protein I [Paenihalocynthiibacter styelae]MBI1495405.1 phage tail protein I [Paenihalocynthiibacter styelae]